MYEFHLALSPFCFTKCMEAVYCIPPLEEQYPHPVPGQLGYPNARPLISTSSHDSCPHEPALAGTQGEPIQECANPQTADRLSRALTGRISDWEHT